MSLILDVYLCDNFIGTLTQDNSGDLELVYDQCYLEATTHGISPSLPSTQKLHKGKIVSWLNKAISSLCFIFIEPGYFA
jgi:HipA-like protein